MHETDAVAAPQRILVVGSGGAGKSRLAQQVGARLGLPVVHLDAHYWRPGWTPTPEKEWHAAVADLIAQDAWVMDGNYSGTLELRLTRADLVLFLDLPRRVTLRRVVRRSLRWHGRTRPDMGQGCPERFDREFLAWVWNYPREGRLRTLTAIEAAGAADRVVTLRSPRNVSRWLRTLPRARSR